MSVANIKKIEARVEALRSELSAVLLELKAAKEYAAGVAEGDVVATGKGEVLVTKVKFLGSGKPWVMGNPRRKDGSWSSVNRHCYTDWEKIGKDGSAA